MASDHHLPEELVIDILSRLPVKSLLRFKSVSKYWYALIKSPCFIHKHLHHPHNHPHLVTNSFIDMSVGNRKTSVSVWVPHGTSVQSRSIDTDYVSPTQTLSIENGPIHGIFLVRRNVMDGLALWNPASRESKTLPPLPEKGRMITFRIPFGFGLHPITKVHKVVWIQNYGDECSVAVLNTLDITHSWTQKQVNPSVFDSIRHISYYSSSVFLDGVCYWLSLKHDFSLLSFDIATEEFQEIQGPQIDLFPDLKRTLMARLTVHNGDSIAVFANPSSKYHISMWVRNPEGGWINKINIGYVEIDVAHGFWNEDLMIVTTAYNTRRRQLALYNTKNNEIRILGFYGYYHNVYFNYKESLYSLQH